MKKIFISVVLALTLLSVMITPVMAAEDEESVSASVTVGEYVSISLSGSISFTGNPGDIDIEANNSPAIQVVVESETNVNVDIGIKGSTTDAIPLANWKYSVGPDNTGEKKSLTGTYSEEYTNVGDGSYNFYHWITIPADTSSGVYTAIVFYKAIKTGGTFE